MPTRLHGTIAAAATPLADRGARLDEPAFGPYADFLVEAGLDGVLAFGTNGEAVLLSLDERRRGLELWLQAVAGRALVAAHCGAQTTADTVALASHAAEAGADAVAVIGPPYFKLDPKAQRAHLLAAASACAPLPFYVYEFAATAGYAFDRDQVIEKRSLVIPDIGIQPVARQQSFRHRDEDAPVKIMTRHQQRKYRQGGRGSGAIEKGRVAAGHRHGL